MPVTDNLHYSPTRAIREARETVESWADTYAYIAVDEGHTDPETIHGCSVCRANRTAHADAISVLISAVESAATAPCRHLNQEERSPGSTVIETHCLDCGASWEGRAPAPPSDASAGIGEVEAWVRLRFDCTMEGSEDVIASAQAFDAALATEREKVAELRKALAKHGYHTGGCASLGRVTSSGNITLGPHEEDCTCGLATALARTEGE